MSRHIKYRVGVFALILDLLAVGYPCTAAAGLVGTGTALRIQEAPQAVQALEGARQQRHALEARLTELGVDPVAARGRIAALTEDEVRDLHQRIDSLPAGGSILALIGAVFVVLLILELVGVTNVFNKI